MQIRCKPTTGAYGAREQEYMVDGNTYNYRIENLQPETDYNVTVEARTQSGYHPGRSTVMRTDLMSELGLHIYRSNYQFQL